MNIAAPPTPSPVLHGPEAVLSLRHGTSWMLLALAAGAVNAGALLACDRFVTHVTGTATRIGVDAGSWLLMFEYILVLLSFIAGAMASVALLQARTYRRKRPLPHVALGGVSIVLVAAALLGSAGVFGPIGGQVEESSDFALLWVLAFAMGLMNASVATSTALAVRTTHMTGPATDFGVHLATAWITTGSERKAALRMALLRGGKIIAFCVGGALMVPSVGALQYGAFAIPAGFILVAIHRSFTSEEPATGKNSPVACPAR